MKREAFKNEQTVVSKTKGIAWVTNSLGAGYQLFNFTLVIFSK